MGCANVTIAFAAGMAGGSGERVTFLLCRESGPDGVTELSGQADGFTGLRRRGVAAISGISQFHAVWRQDHCVEKRLCKCDISRFHQPSQIGQYVGLGKLDVPARGKALRYFSAAC